MVLRSQDHGGLKERVEFRDTRGLQGFFNEGARESREPTLKPMVFALD